MKKCDLCRNLEKLLYRMKSEKYIKWILCCKECWYIISKQKNIYMEELGKYENRIILN